MFYHAPRSATAFGGVDYGMHDGAPAASPAYLGYPMRPAAPPLRDDNKQWRANPSGDPECGFGMCMSDAECSDDMQCGFTKSSRPPSGSMCDGKPCEGYKCCQPEYTDYEGWDVPDVADVVTLCPFDANLNCPFGCQVCNGATPGSYQARCCDENSACPFTSECQIPCTASSQFQGEGVGCMFCPDKGGLMACTAQTEPCIFQNQCTANSQKKYVRPPKKDVVITSPLAMQELQVRARDQALGSYRAARFSQRTKENFW